MTQNQEDRINTPANIVTICRICLIPLFVVALLSPWPSWFGLEEFVGNHEKAIIATVLFVIISATDFVDGYLARSRNEITTFGKFMDPLADKMLVIAALLALIELKILPSWPVIIIIAREFIVSGIRMLAAQKGVVIAASWWGKAKTTFQIIAIVLFLLKEGVSSLNSVTVFTDPLYLLAWTTMIIALVLTVVSMFDYINGFIKIVSLDEDVTSNNELQDKASMLIESLKSKKLKVITAESLTGGMISQTLTSIPGSSEVVLGGIASYAFELKRDALGVDFSYLLADGAVNSETASQMVIGALNLSDANVAVSVTGIAGPSGAEEGKPVGTVYFGVMTDKNKEVTTFRKNFKGSRDEIRKQTSLCAIEELINVVSGY